MDQLPPRIVKGKTIPSQEKVAVLKPRLVRPILVQEPTQQRYFSSLLGTDGEKVLELGDKERRSGLYIEGRPGMGKSALMANLALQDADHGHGLFVLDPHADASQDSLILNIFKRIPLHRKDHVLYFDLTDKTHTFGINLVECRDPADLNMRRDTYTKAYEVFLSLWKKDWGQWMQLIIANLIRVLIENQDYTLAAAPQFLTDAKFRQKLVDNVQYNLRVKDFWNYQFAGKKTAQQEQEVNSTLTRVWQLLTDTDVDHVINQKKTTLDFAQIMDERKIVLVSLPANFSSDTRRFLGTILVRELLFAARARRDISQFCVFIDEFQSVVTRDFADIIRQTRKFGIAPTLAQQFSLGEEHEEVNEAIEAMGNIVLFRPTKKGAERKAKEFAKRPEPTRLQVLEEERREVLEEERRERIVDEIDDGYEPVLESKGDLVGHLLKQGHKDPRVMAFVRKYLLDPSKKDLSGWFNGLLYDGMVHPGTIVEPLPEEARKAIIAESTFTHVFGDSLDGYTQFGMNGDELVRYSNGYQHQAEDVLVRLLPGARPSDEGEERGLVPAIDLDANVLSLQTVRRFFADLERAISADAAKYPDMTDRDFQERIMEYLSRIDRQDFLREVLAQALRKVRAEYNANKKPLL